MNEGNLSVSLLKKRLLKGGIWAFSGKIFAAIAGISVNLLLARILQPKSLGEFYLIQTLVISAATISLLGFNQGMPRFIAEEIAKNTEYNIPILLKRVSIFILGTTIVVLFLFFVIFNSSFESILNLHSLSGLTLLITFWIIFATGLSIISESFRGMHRIDFSTIFGSSIKGGVFYYILFSFFLLLYYQFGIDYSLKKVIEINVLVLLIIFLLSIKFLYENIRKYYIKGKSSKVDFKKRIFIILPMFISGLAMLILTKSDLWIVSYYLGNEDVAVYGSAIKLIYAVNSSLVIINSFLPPIISDLYVKKEFKLLEKTLRTSATIAMIPAFFLLLMFVLFSSEILNFVYGAFYQQGSVVLIILSIGQLFNVLAGSSSFALTMTSFERQSLIITLISGVLTIILSFSLVSYWGINGVAFAFSLGMVLRKFAMIFYVKYKLGIWTYSYVHPKDLMKLTIYLKKVIR